MDAGRRIYMDLHDPERWLRDLLRGVGAFVPTRIPLALGEVFTLSARVKNVSQPLDLPVRVLGRRVPRGAQGILSAGVVVHLADPFHPTARLLLDLARGDIVDFEARLKERMRLPARTPAADLAEIAGVAARLLEDQEDDPVLLPVDVGAQPGDRLRLTFAVPRVEHPPTIDVEVKGVVLRDGERSVRCRLFDDAGRRRAEALVRAHDAVRRA